MHELKAVLARGLKAESRYLSRKREIVVDGFRHMTDADLSTRVLGDLTGGKHGIIAANGYQVSDVQSIERLEQPRHVFGLFRRISPGGVKDRAPLEMNA